MVLPGRCIAQTSKESSCWARACYADSADAVPTYCKAHALQHIPDAMVRVKHWWQCQMRRCARKATHGFVLGSALTCRTHAFPKAIVVVYRLCSCGARARFRLPGDPRHFCWDHAPPHSVGPNGRPRDARVFMRRKRRGAPAEVAPAEPAPAEAAPAEVAPAPAFESPAECQDCVCDYCN